MGLRFRCLTKREVAVVQGAHGGHEADCFLLIKSDLPPCPVLWDGTQDGNRRIWERRDGHGTLMDVPVKWRM